MALAVAERAEKLAMAMALVLGMLILSSMSVCARESICFPPFCADVLETLQQEDLSLLQLSDVDIRSYAGGGAFGTVYRAQERSTGRVIVVKEIKKLHPRVLMSGMRDKYFGERFQRDGGHDLVNIVRYISSFEDGESLFLVFEDEGSPINTSVPAPGHRRIFKQLLKAVEACHVRGIYHRDIKPGNMVVNQSGHVRLLDFGSAIDSFAAANLYGRSGPQRQGEVDPRYAAPEYFHPRSLFHLEEGEKFDMFSLGVTLLELITGTRCGLRILVPDDAYMHFMWRLLKCPPDYSLSTSEAAHDLLLQLLAFKPSARVAASQALKHRYILGKHKVADHDEL